MQALLLGPGPIYEKKSIVKTSVNCPVFPKLAPISSASLLSARWLSNLSSTVFGTAHIFYAFAISLLWSGTSGDLLFVLFLFFNVFNKIILSQLHRSNFSSGNGTRQDETESRRHSSMHKGVYPLPIESFTTNLSQLLMFSVSIFFGKC